jgi:aldose 1-epimerase
VAEVACVGAALRTLAHDGRDLVVGFPASGVRPLYRGVLAAPWPNRIGEGRDTFGGSEYQLPLDEPDRRTALHGLVMWDTWQVRERTPDRVVLGHRLNPRTGYPFMLDLEATYVVSEQGLVVALRAVNSGDAAAPYGCTFHPYLRAGAGPVDRWSLELPAASYLDVDARGLPAGPASVEGTPYDFRSPRVIAATAIDHAFTGRDGPGRQVRLLDGDGSGVEMAWDATFPWVQVYTSDHDERRHHRTGRATAS